MDLYDVAIARALAGGGGGGGSSDFSTATVTVTVASAQDVSVAMINPEDGTSTGGYQFSDNDTQTLTVILYKGSVVFSATSGILTATGDIELPPFPIPACTIHGDGTITIS